MSSCPENYEVRQMGTISDPSLFVFNAAIAPTLPATRCQLRHRQQRARACRSWRNRRLGSDPLGTMSPPIALASSAAADSDFSCPSVNHKSELCRWGDYAGASVDPANTDVAWGSNQVNGPAGL